MAYDKETGMTHKQILFCQEYLVDLNATQAAIRAGYSEDTAKVIGCENMTKPSISSYIDQLQQLRAERTKITIDRVITELGKMGFADTRHLFTKGGCLIPLCDLPEDITASIQLIEVTTRPSGEKDENGYSQVEHIHKIKMCDKKAALELLGKNLKLFNTVVEGKIEHTHNHRVISESTGSILNQIAGQREDTSDKAPSTH